MTDTLNLQAYSEILNQNLNQDVIEALDKFSQSNITSKELKEKTIESIFLLFVNKLTHALQNTEYNCLTDLILNKSFLIVEQTGKSEWPLIESLKVTNFDPLSIFIYNYLKYKYHIRGKFNKEALHKAFDNLYLLLMKFLEKLNTPFSDEILWAFFNDLFDIYVKLKENGEDLSEVEEKIENMSLEVDEVTRNEIINPDNHKEYVIGVLFLLFKYRIESFSTGKANEVLIKYKNLFMRSNSDYLKKSAPIVQFDIEILSNISLFFQNDQISSISNLFNLLKYLRLFRKFKKNLFIIEHLNVFETTIRQLIAIFLVSSGLRINEFVRQILGLSNDFVESLCTRETNGLERILSNSIITYLKNISILVPLSNHAFGLRNKPVDGKTNEEILKVFYTNIFTRNEVKKTDDLLEIKGQFNKEFNQIYSILNK